MSHASGLHAPGSLTPGPSALADGTILSPFSRLRHLLDGIAPGHEKPIDLTLGEPRETMPAFIGAKIREAEAEYARYPAMRGTDELRGAIAEWIGRRYGLSRVVDAGREILPCNGSREGLFYAAFAATGRKRVDGRPAVLMCNPFYQAYLGAALATGSGAGLPQCDRGHRPSSRSRRNCGRQGAARAHDRLLSLLAGQPAGRDREPGLHRPRARPRAHHDFMLFLDECYSEIYAAEPPQAGSRSRPRPPSASATSSSSTRCRSARTCRGCARASAAGDGDFLSNPVRGAQSRRAAGAGADATRLRRGLVGRSARRSEPAGLPAQIRRRGRGARRAASATGGRAAASFFGSI